jgi:uncharacterized protein with HEPN domain
MREAAREIEEFIKGVSYDEFVLQKPLRYAIERQIIVIGEAAKRMSDTFKKVHPEIPWSSIVGQRNVLAHEYGEVLLERVWLVATERIPELIHLLEPLIPPPPKIDG